MAPPADWHTGAAPPETTRMSASPESLGHITAEQYLDFENSPHASRHELVDGWLYAMVGGTLRHEHIALNLAAALSTHLAGGPCRPYKGDLKLRLGDDFYYPDIIVRCDVDTSDDATWLSDADVIIEVLSPSTQRYDRGDKRIAYWRAPSLAEYITVAQHEQLAERQRAPGSDIERIQGEGAELHIARLDFRMPLADLYV